MRNNSVKILFISILLMFFWTDLISQRTATHDDPQASFRKALELFDKGLYGIARNEFSEIIKKIDDPNNEVRISAEYYQAICAVELFNDDAELLLTQFIENHPHSSHLRIIHFQMGKYQYRKQNYRNAIKSFEKVDAAELSVTEKSELYFKRGYSYFFLKQYEESQKDFFRLIEKDNVYKNLANYYYAHIAYLNGNYETALKGFVSLKDDADLKAIIPYYISHIYYMQSRFEDLLSIAVPLYEKSTPERKSEMARLIGEAYYHTEQYEKAIPYLETFYAQTAATAQGQYQLGYAYYRSGKYDLAIEQFKHIGIGTDSLAQNANYHLGLCYLKTNKKSFALNAFKYASESEADVSITEDALYNYAKLSYELDYNPYNNAIRAFEKYLNEYPNSAHRKEVMENLAKMYLSTKNYKQARASIERINNRSAEMNNAYQRIIYAIAVQDFNNGEYGQAEVDFTLASSLNYNKNLVAPAKYWRAEALSQKGDYENAIQGFRDFLTSSGAISLPYYNRAYYNMGYAYFSQKKYSDADLNFRIFIRNEKDQQSLILNDATLRLADCYFIRSQYVEAIENYDKAIQLGLVEVDYALYKKAEAYGAISKPDLKAQTFEKLLQDYPKSSYAGNAELALAKTYFNSLGDNQKAITHYTHIIDNFPIQQNFVKKAMLDLGLVYSNMGDNDKALEVWKKVNENYRGTQESKDALSAMRNIYVSLNRVDEFFEYVKSLGLKPSTTQQDSITYLAAENIYMKGDCDQSSQGFVEYLNRFPAGAYATNARFYLADCEFRASLFEKALEDYQFVVNQPVSSFSERSWERIAYIYYHKKDDYQKAYEAYNSLLNIAEYKANIETAKIGIMRSLWNLGDTSKVVSAAAKVLEISQLKHDVKTEALMISAKAYLTQKQDSLATSYLDRVIMHTTSEQAAEARYLKALHAFSKGDLQKSESIIFDIIQQEPSYEYWVAKALILSADIFVQTDNVHQAVATLQSIIEGYEGDQALIDEAKAKLEAIQKKSEEKVESLPESQDIIIDLKEDWNPDLFILDESEIIEE
ncbi:MAG: tetratricopeptide repeat protein [Bacteroidales bacterium]|nr:tetratricopeptide repeat protein [Bacteroidales bacterium]